ncbi:DegT/DnrJ/EryC1/StrS family aminotransferase [Celeribacter marinus]|uniref:Aminotransferase, DegT/DnrJ/EryC1/StrS family n=1 Tax=Celeribacter marinus TaxID=1397108 RepID=A0A0P0ABY1_9RHOB|nr:DegT/DnrJ/EryC1/StrS family aminotransferase [Celeribacter marinus]ALI56384.1 aminotransferase, DegT/DnrJ/EryC1/StrS family [Celeribacter marinus]SFK44393.1 dTDP-4-amino-4,6-dideoxygalactose transaminase [Celeribacter marinus]
MSGEVFRGNFTQQEPIPEEAIERAVEVLRSGRLHRYNVLPDEAGEVALLEQEFAALAGARYALAVASGGYALGCALRAVGVAHGDAVLTNAFTLAPVPGAIASVGARSIFVGVTEGLVIDLDDLQVKIADSGARVLMLSHMRGHIVDMDALMYICNGAGVTVIEDCAHTMGATWDGVPSGRHGTIACYSTQTYKHINSGEGGLLVTDDDEIAAKAILLSGSYMLYGAHTARPPLDVFEKVKYDTPNVSGRMDHLRAAILRVQLRHLPDQVANWNARYRVVEEGVRDVAGLTLIDRPQQEGFVGSSIQFLLLDWADERIKAVVAACKARGVELKWFGAPDPVAFTSRYDNWRYADPQPLPDSDRVLRAIVDMRLPLTFSLDDCVVIARIIKDEVVRIH